MDPKSQVQRERHRKTLARGSLKGLSQGYVQTWQSGSLGSALYSVEPGEAKLCAWLS